MWFRRNWLGFSLLILTGWAAFHLGAVEPVRFFPIFLGLAVLFIISAAGGMQVGLVGWLLLVPLVPMQVNGSASVEILQYLALWMAILLAGHQMGKYEDGINPLIYGLLAIGAVEALLGLSQSLARFAGASISASVPFQAGTFYNRNHYAGFLEMLVPLFLVIGLSRIYGRRGFSRRRLMGSPVAAGSSPADRVAKAWLFLLGGAVLLLAILFSLSRSGIVAAVIGIIVSSTLFFLSLKRRSDSNHSHGKLLAFCFASVVIASSLWIGLEPVVMRFEEALGPESSHREGRITVWKQTSQMIADNPWIGVGAGMHGWEFAGYQDSSPDLFYDYAHNDYLQAAAEWGIPAALVFFGVIVLIVIRSASASLHTSDPMRTAQLAGGAGGISALLVHSLTDFNLHIPSNALIFGLLLGSIYGLTKRVEVGILVPLEYRLRTAQTKIGEIQRVSGKTK